MPPPDSTHTVVQPTPFDATVRALPQRASHGHAICPHCLNALPYVLPVEPLYDLPLAAQLIPMSANGLRKYLSRHRDEFGKRYRKDRQQRLHRMLTASEIKRIRQALFIFKTPGGERRAPDAHGN